MTSLRVIGLCLGAWCLACVALLGPACSGKAVVDEPDGGSSSSSSSSSGSSSSASSSGSSSSTTETPTYTTTDCDTLSQELAEWTALATACDSCVDEPQCGYLSGQELTDVCGCPLPVSPYNMGAVQGAVAAYSAWKMAGCGPKACGQPCAISNNPGCAGGPDPSCDGICVP